MNQITRLFLPILLLTCQALLGAPSPAPAPALPQPLAAHPGNIFLAGEEVVLSPRLQSERWLLFDDAENKLAELTPAEGKLHLGRLPVGFYRLRPADATNAAWISAGVLAPLQSPTPPASPVALDVAMSWFYTPEKMDAVASLCALAGVNWVRDRLNWGEMEPQKERFAASNRYDASALAQSRAGLRVLQVNHISPGWANPEHKRFPLDLRDAYRFYREMTRRWQGKVLAFEPWNEADIPMFGGHTGAEMAALQKAACLGLKAGNPDVIACLNVFALHNQAQLADLHANQAWPYFETFNLHHYAPFDEYPSLYADFRAVSAGRPLWVTECSLPVKWAGNADLKEPTDADLRVQAERVAKTFACSLHEGAAATFYFLLPHYVEGQTQFGVVRPDLTPRPAFVALAAVGRLLADARPLGRVKSTDETVRAFLFRAKPDGRSREVLVAWTTKGEATLGLPVTAEAMFDHLGRTRDAATTLGLTTAPVFAVLPAGTAKRLTLTPPPPAPAFAKGEPSPIVLQALWPKDKIDLKKSAYRIAFGQVETIPVYIYNFSSRTAQGRLRVQGGVCKASLTNEVELAPQERRELALVLDGRDATPGPAEILTITGDFESAGKPVLSLRLVPVGGQ